MFAGRRSEITPPSEQVRNQKVQKRALFFFRTNRNNLVDRCEGNFFSNRDEVSKLDFSCNVILNRAIRATSRSSQ